MNDKYDFWKHTSKWISFDDVVNTVRFMWFSTRTYLFRSTNINSSEQIFWGARDKPVAKAQPLLSSGAHQDPLVQLMFNSTNSEILNAKDQTNFSMTHILQRWSLIYNLEGMNYFFYFFFVFFSVMVLWYTGNNHTCDLSGV